MNDTGWRGDSAALGISERLDHEQTIELLRTLSDVRLTALRTDR